MSVKKKIAERAAREIRQGDVVNFGIGIPTLIPGFLPADSQICVHSENGFLGMGERCARGSEDRNLIDAGGAYVQLAPGASFFDSALSFALVRAGRLDVSFLGALEVGAAGDLANWIIPGKYAPGIGGAMEIAQKAKRLIITTTHCDRRGKPKLKQNCSLPLTAKGCVDLVITELAVLKPQGESYLLLEVAREAHVDQIREATEADLVLPPDGPGRF